MDFLDPNNWTTVDTHEHRIYLNDQASLWVVVDYEDYLWAVQWRWNLLRMHGGNRKPKLYARRATSHWANGIRLFVKTTLLHVEIMQRSGIEPPSDKHSIVDHANGDSLNCRRGNLIWATPSQNRRNVKQHNRRN